MFAQTDTPNNPFGLILKCCEWRQHFLDIRTIIALRLPRCLARPTRTAIVTNEQMAADGFEAGELSNCQHGSFS
ncbi:hypothetical protein VTO73DRAFT_7275 [Trametes versicolor]